MLFAIFVADAMLAQSGGSGGNDAGSALAGGLGCVCYLLFFVLFGLIPLIGVWKVFEKAGEPGWAALVPIYNVMVLAKVAGRPEWHGLLLYVPCVGIVFAFMICMDIAQAFGKETGFGIGLALLGPIFWPMLGFGSARYQGAAGGAGGGSVSRPRRRMDVEEEEDEPRPRRRRPDVEDED